MPKNITNTKGIYEFINLLWATCKTKSNSTIILDCSKTRSMNLNIMAPLGLVLTKIKSNKNKVYFRNLNKDIKNRLLKAGFIGENIKLEQDISQNCIKYKSFSGDENNLFRDYIMSQLSDIKDSEVISVLISRIMEIFINVKMHARIKDKSRYGNKEVFSGGEYYKDKNYIVFSVANNGLTLKDNIEGFLKIKLQRECDYIKWSLKESNSTRETRSEGPGGLGLFLLDELVRECRGTLIIASGKGFYKTDVNNPNENEELDLNCIFPGTVITVKIPIEYVKIENKEINEGMIFDVEYLLKGE